MQSTLETDHACAKMIEFCPSLGGELNRTRELTRLPGCWESPV